MSKACLLIGAVSVAVYIALIAISRLLFYAVYKNLAERMYTTGYLLSIR